MKVTIDYEEDNQGTVFIQKCMEIEISYLIESYDWEQINEEVREDGKVVMRFTRLPDGS